MATLNIGMKVNRAISGATTVNANAIAVVTYISGAATPTTFAGVGSPQGTTSIRTFGPGQNIPASYSVSFNDNSGAFSVTFTLASGFELINTI